MTQNNVSTVHKNDGEYIAYDGEENIVGKGRKLNIGGRSITVAEDSLIHFESEVYAYEIGENTLLIE